SVKELFATVSPKDPRMSTARVPNFSKMLPVTVQTRPGASPEASNSVNPTWQYRTMLLENTVLRACRLADVATWHSSNTFPVMTVSPSSSSGPDEPPPVTYTPMSG